MPGVLECKCKNNEILRTCAGWGGRESVKLNDYGYANPQPYFHTISLTNITLRRRDKNVILLK